MNRTIIDKIKSYILLLLILTSLIQVGILWSYQNHGLPISFLKDIFGEAVLPSSDMDMKTRDEFFKPFRLTVSNGDESHWLIDENQDYYRKLWGEAQSYLRVILSSKQTSQSMPVSEWGNLVIKRAFIFEFKSTVNYELLRWFLDIANSQTSERQGMHKMLIIPSKSDSKAEIYILDDTGVRRYDIPYNKNNLTYEEYEKMLTRLENDRDSDKKVFGVTQELGLRGDKYSISPDILCVVRGSKYREYHNIEYSIPDKLQDLSSVVNGILGNERDSYDRYTDTQGTIVLKNLNNIYRVYSDGLLEYKYIPGAEGAEKGEISSALINAGGFVFKMSEHLLDSRTDIYLSRVEQEENFYRFIFNYKIGEFPVHLNYSTAERNGDLLKDAVVVEATSKRILSGRWLLKNFEVLNEVNSYDMVIGDIVMGTGVNFEKMSIKDMGVSYVITSDERKSLEPVWLIERTGADNIAVPLKKEKGE